MSKIKGNSLPHMPWEDRPAGNGELMWRYSGNPVTVWNMSRKMARVYNSAVVPFDDGFAGVFRADHKDGRARIHRGFSKDAIHWNIENDEIMWKDETGEVYQPGYAYDPRVVRLGDMYYIVWCTDFGGGAALGFGCTKDFKTFTRLENICIPFNRNGVPFPRKVNGKYLMLSRPSDSGHTPFGDIFLSESPDLVHWGRHRKVMSSGASGWWQGVKIGAGPVPIETDEGWLLLYHGVSTTCNGFVYSMGAALLDIDTPSKVLYRTKNYLLTPEEPYETAGFVPNVVFPCATLHDADTGR
ncbi:MAG: glycoside hydrolase family 130 protein, partial [Spirochaetales bacterium]|nr:glycoside hydrolase family 130 protein [Spirochaetales bacterium]